ncbi:VOC family protein [Burkholderia cenocepacia]|uniref:bleomycin resistance protein n=1 Tax=Burkholderia TaxID=32008 RepID=UPI0009815E2F|nr:MULTISPECIES: VOC family protein [Burkholderia]AQQ43651.1 aldoketomutase [Burkholderia cenocepacia]ELW9448640.1 VOC family protein [Burkholderia cenocepacia]MBG0878548.1 VOC family protein [Burkholderia sp. 9775_39]MBG0885665.1 VOC family protein [Burkholderia sp. 9773_38]MBR8484553.1 VOC family protein [Burkholderia cenocepacia]
MEWAALVPELICSDLAGSVRFYRDVLGFRIRFERPEDGFAYLELGGAQLMLEQQSPESWLTGAMEPPFGRGINLQIEVDAVGPIHGRIVAAGVALFADPRTSWYRQDDIEHGQIEMLVQDPDGYLLRLVEILPERPVQG